MSDIIIALDISLRETGYAIKTEQGEIITGTIKTPKIIKDFERAKYQSDKINNLISKYYKQGKTKIAIEGYSFGSNTNTLTQIAELVGIVKYHVYYNDYEVIPPTVIKKYITGKGNAKKDIVMMKIYKKWGREFGNNNEADAFGLLKYIEAKYE